jgi:acetyl esterase/lipase
MRTLLSFVAAAALAAPAAAQELTFTRTEDVIYGRKFGLAMTMDVFVPKEKPNGAAVVYCVSGGWFSVKAGPNPGFVKPFTDHGYTVFAVTHGSQPKFAIPEILDDMSRAVRFIRHNANKYNIDPDRLGISGGSAGGHLSLMQGTAPKPANPKAPDPVDRESAKIQAVGCFFPPTDFLNYGKEGENAVGVGILKGFKAPFAFTTFDQETKSFVPVTDPEKRNAIAREISPAYHVTKDSAPALIFHGDADKLVPIQQSELMIAKYKEAGVPCELVVKKGAGHGWPGMDKDYATIADWFDTYLKK